MDPNFQNKQSKQSGNKDQQTTASKKKSKKGSKDTVLSVYNWQFVHSVHLWCQLLQDSHPSDALEPLIYPLIQLINGAIKLVYSSAFFPLRFVGRDLDPQFCIMYILLNF